MREKLYWLGRSNALKLVRMAFWPTIRTPFVSVWSKIAQRITYFPLYSLLSRKMVALFVSIGKWEKLKTLQWSHSKLKSFLLSSILRYLQLVTIQTILFLFGKFLLYPSNKNNNDCFEYCPRSSLQHRKLGWCLDLGYHFPVKMEKSLIIVLFILTM